MFIENHMKSVILVLLVLTLCLGTLSCSPSTEDADGIVQVVAGYDNRVMVLMADGTIRDSATPEYSERYGRMSEYSRDITSIRNVIKLAAGDHSFAALMEDGTVVCDDLGVFALMRNNTVPKHPMLDLSSWSNIVDIACGTWHVAGLQEDGTLLVAAGDPYFQDGWAADQMKGSGRLGRS